MAKRRDDAWPWLLLLGGGLFLWTRRATASIGEIVILPGPVVIPEPDDGSARPSSESDDLEAGLESGLSWQVWTEPLTPGYRTWRHAIRNSRGELLGWGSLSAYTIGDSTDKATARTNEIAGMRAHILELVS